MEDRERTPANTFTVENELKVFFNGNELRNIKRLELRKPYLVDIDRENNQVFIETIDFNKGKI